MRLRIARQPAARLLATCLLAAWAASGGLRAQDPTRVDSASRAVAASIAERAAEYPELAERFAAVEAAWETYGASATFPVACALVRETLNMAKERADRDAALDSAFAFVATLDRGRLSPRESVHFDFELARYRAASGDVNAGEAEILRILGLDPEETFPATRARAHYMAAYCSYYTGQLDRAASHSALAAAGFLAMGDRLGAMEALDGAGTTYFALGRLDSALHYGRRGLALAEGLPRHKLANLYLNYAEALAASGRIDSAFHYAGRGDDIIADGGSWAAIARSQLCLGNLSAGIGRFPEAVEHYESAVEHFDLANEQYHKLNPLDSLHHLHARSGDFREAYYAGIRAYSLRDSLRAARARQDADKLVAEYERDALAKELAASRGERALARAVISQRATERGLVVATVCLLLLLIAFAVYRARLRRRHAAGLQREVDVRTAELRERQASLERQTRRLAASNAELERFAYIASHDLKTPLRNVTSFLGLVERRLDPAGRAAVSEYLEIAKANALQMHDLVTDVLEFSRLDADLAAITSPVTVSSVVETTRVASSGELAERNARVECVGDAELVLPKGALEQVIANLVGNGLKYNRAPRPLVRVVVADLPDDRVRIAVTDNGIGIDPEFHERVFEVFRRLHTADEFGGTGVGLAACRKVVERLGGTIALDSAVGRGSTFTVDLPRHLPGDGDGDGDREPATAVPADAQQA